MTECSHKVRRKKRLFSFAKEDKSMKNNHNNNNINKKSSDQNKKTCDSQPFVDSKVILGSLLLSSRCKNKSCSFLCAHFTETMNVVENLLNIHL